MKSKELEVKDFDIIVGDGSELVNADIPVRWCVSKELMASLKEKDINRPHILFCTIDDRGREMGRQIFPLEDLMAYVRFERPDLNKLHAFIIDNTVNKGGRDKQLSTRELSKMWCWKSGKYDFDMQIFDEGELYYKEYNWVTSSKYILEDCMVEVDIPKELFAKEPPLWFLNIVNMWHDTVIQDQCHFRQRVLMTVFFKGWFIGIGAVLGSLINLVSALLMFGLGFKHTNWNPILHPYSYTLFRDVWTDFEINDNYMFMPISKKIINDGIFPLTILFSPFLVLLVAGLAYTAPAATILAALMTSFKILLTAGLMITAVAGMVIGGFALKEWIQSKNFTILESNPFVSVAEFALTPLFYFAEKVDAYFEKREKARVAEMYNSEEAIYCPKKSDNLVASIYALPEKKRTVKLRVMEIKNKFCKPMPKM